MANFASLTNLTSYNPPIPILPTAPNFAFCHEAYGVGLKREDALSAGSYLPYGSRPVIYSISPGKPPEGRARFFQLPLDIRFGGVTISIEVASPVDFDSISITPTDLRGMAGYLANYCVGARGKGGWVTKNIQGVVDYVTDPTTDLDVKHYPQSTAFVTLTISKHSALYSFPGDYDPQMAVFLQRKLADTLGRVPLHSQVVIADRIVRFAVKAQSMQRLETEAWWDDMDLDGVQNSSRLSTKIQRPHAMLGSGTDDTSSRRRTRIRPLQIA